MHLVIECLRCERACRALAAELTHPDDKRALELMAAGWARRAAERLRKIDSEATAFRAPLCAPSGGLRTIAADDAPGDPAAAAGYCRVA